MFPLLLSGVTTPLTNGGKWKLENFSHQGEEQPFPGPCSHCACLVLLGDTAEAALQWVHHISNIHCHPDFSAF